MLRIAESDTSGFQGSLGWNYPTGHKRRRVLEGGQEVILDGPAQGGYTRSYRSGCTLENYGIHNSRKLSLDSWRFAKAKVHIQNGRYFYGTVSFCLIPLQVYAVCMVVLQEKKLSPPIQVLADANKTHIESKDLDFTVDYNRNDELGRLCTAFEEMRQALYDNNRQLWNMIEQRRILQASVAHDLRNPIAIVEGYVEYMQQCLADGNLNDEELRHTLSNLAVTAKRLEHYTDYIRDLECD